MASGLATLRKAGRRKIGDAAKHGAREPFRGGQFPRGCHLLFQRSCFAIQRRVNYTCTGVKYDIFFCGWKRKERNERKEELDERGLRTGYRIAMEIYHGEVNRFRGMNAASKGPSRYFRCASLNRGEGRE